MNILKEFFKRHVFLSFLFVFIFILLLGSITVFFIEFNNRSRISVDFLGVEGSSEIIIEINHGDLSHCTIMEDEIERLRNNELLKVSCSNRFLPFIKYQIEVHVEGLLEYRASSYLDIIHTVRNTIAPSLENIEPSTLSEILYHSDEEEGITLIAVFIIDDDSFNYYFIEDVYISNDQIVTYHNNEITNGMTVNATSIGASLSDYDNFIQLYLDLGYEKILDE